jgi:hypothetical protein
MAAVRSRLLVCLLALVGCGGEPEKPPPVPKQPVMCPASHPVPAGQPPIPFDARTLVGLEQGAATRVANRHGCDVTVITPGSNSSGAFLPNRLSVRLINGKVVSVEVG